MKNFVGNRNKFFALAGALVVLTLAGMLIFGLNLDIQFTGGTIITYSYEGDLSFDEAGNVLESVVGEPMSMRGSESYTTGQKLVEASLTSTKHLETEKLEAMTRALNEAFPENNIAVQETSSVNAANGREFFIKCIVAMVFAAVIMILYIGLRFKKISGWSAGVTAVVALIHDVIIVCAVFLVFRFPVNDSFVAVVLTILGYSINNTIVIYDRIRENKGGSARMPVAELVNISENQTLARTLNTTITTVIALITISIVALIFNVQSILVFSLPMMVGVIAGLFSSLFVAPMLWVVWQQRKENKAA